MVELIVILFVLVAVLALFPIPRRGVEQVVFWCIGLALFALAAFRGPDNSPDYESYLSMYRDHQTLLVEPSFRIISWFVESVFDNSLFLFVIYAFLAVFLKLKAIKDISPLWILGVITYMSTVYIIQEHAQIRAGVATAFFLLAIKPLHQGKWKPFLLLALMATLFHYSAAIIFPLWFVVRARVNRWLLWGLIPVGYLIYLADINLISYALPFEYIQSKLELYQQLQEMGQGDFDKINVFGFGILLKCLFFYWLVFFRETIRQHNQYIDTLLILYCIGIFLIPAFAAMPVVSFRLSAILVSVEMLLFPMFYYIFASKFAGRLMVVLIASVNMFLSLQIISP